jgi:hypothetical protein
MLCDRLLNQSLLNLPCWLQLGSSRCFTFLAMRELQAGELLGSRDKWLELRVTQTIE